jgi:hypothetical protein
MEILSRVPGGDVVVFVRAAMIALAAFGARRLGDPPTSAAREAREGHRLTAAP